MLIIRKIMHYKEFLEESRNPMFSKLEVKVSNNKSLKNTDLLVCNMYLKMYDTERFVHIEGSIKGSLLNLSRREDIELKYKEEAGAYLAYFNTGIMTYVPIKIMRKMMELENKLNVNLSIPNEIKKIVTKYHINGKDI